MDRSELLKHLNKTRFATGDRDSAIADAKRIAAFVKQTCRAEVIGVGSLFESPRPFTVNSDIDLVVKGIPADEFFRISAQVDGMSSFEVNLIPWESANELMIEIVESGGVKL
jgi:hypothetical protein